MYSNSQSCIICVGVNTQQKPVESSPLLSRRKNYCEAHYSLFDTTPTNTNREQLSPVTPFQMRGAVIVSSSNKSDHTTRPLAERQSDISSDNSWLNIRQNYSNVDRLEEQKMTLLYYDIIKNFDAGSKNQKLNENLLFDIGKEIINDTCIDGQAESMLDLTLDGTEEDDTNERSSSFGSESSSVINFSPSRESPIATSSPKRTPRKSMSFDQMLHKNATHNNRDPMWNVVYHFSSEWQELAKELKSKHSFWSDFCNPVAIRDFESALEKLQKLVNSLLINEELRHPSQTQWFNNSIYIEHIGKLTPAGLKHLFYNRNSKKIYPINTMFGVKNNVWYLIGFCVMTIIAIITILFQTGESEATTTPIKPITTTPDPQLPCQALAELSHSRQCLPQLASLLIEGINAVIHETRGITTLGALLSHCPGTNFDWVSNCCVLIGNYVSNSSTTIATLLQQLNLWETGGENYCKGHTTLAPTTHRPTTHRPTTHRPTTHHPTTHRPTTHRPTTHRPTTHRPTTHRPTPPQPSVTTYCQGVNKTLSSADACNRNSSLPFLQVALGWIQNHTQGNSMTLNMLKEICHRMQYDTNFWTLFECCANSDLFRALSDPSVVVTSFREILFNIQTNDNACDELSKVSTTI